MEKSQIKYFLAANSCEGFVSHFADCYSPEDGWKAYIIKGGPGTGKSSFMKYAAALGEKSGLFYELFPCSSDPNSLDAVIFPHIKTVIMDGTAPHIVDPACAGVCDNVLNFGEFWDCDVLCDSRQQIIEKTKQNKELHRSSARYIRSAGNIPARERSRCAFPGTIASTESRPLSSSSLTVVGSFSCFLE